jgi:hypothetical protein
MNPSMELKCGWYSRHKTVSANSTARQGKPIVNHFKHHANVMVMADGGDEPEAGEGDS